MQVNLVTITCLLIYLDINNRQDQCEVFINPDGVVYEAVLHQVKVEMKININKFYRMQLLSSKTEEKYFLWLRWGRVGVHGDGQIFTEGSLANVMKAFENKFHDKTGLRWLNRFNPPKIGKYSWAETSYEEDPKEEDDSNSNKILVKCQLPEPTQYLMQLIFDQQLLDKTKTSIPDNFGALPLAKLSKRVLQEGYERLEALAELAARAPPSTCTTKTAIDHHMEVDRLTSAYYSTIPHLFGRDKPPSIYYDEQIWKEIEMLDSLTDMEVANGLIESSKKEEHPLDYQYSCLGMKEMTPRK